MGGGPGFVCRGAGADSGIWSELTPPGSPDTWIGLIPFFLPPPRFPRQPREPLPGPVSPPAPPPHPAPTGPRWGVSPPLGGRPGEDEDGALPGGDTQVFDPTEGGSPRWCPHGSAVSPQTHRATTRKPLLGGGSPRPPLLRPDPPPLVTPPWGRGGRRGASVSPAAAAARHRPGYSWWPPALGALNCGVRAEPRNHGRDSRLFPGKIA